jgi:hypothetical protein
MRGAGMPTHTPSWQQLADGRFCKGVEAALLLRSVGSKK